MNNYLYILVLIPTLAFADPQILTFDSYCDKTENIFKALRERFNEMPYVTGTAEDMANSTMSMWVNPTTGTWSILSTKNALTCVIGTGGKFKLFPYDKSNT
jgi:hypothetical protein